MTQTATQTGFEPTAAPSIDRNRFNVYCRNGAQVSILKEFANRNGGLFVGYKDETIEGVTYLIASLDMPISFPANEMTGYCEGYLGGIGFRMLIHPNPDLEADLRLSCIPFQAI